MVKNCHLCNSFAITWKWEFFSCVNFFAKKKKWWYLYSLLYYVRIFISLNFSQIRENVQSSNYLQVPENSYRSRIYQQETVCTNRAFPPVCSRGILQQGRKNYEEAILSYQRAIHFRPSLARKYFHYFPANVYSEGRSSFQWNSRVSRFFLSFFSLSTDVLSIEACLPAPPFTR